MKKRLSILFVLLICMLSGAQAQLTKTIELTEADTLEAALGDDIANVTELIVKGPLNDDDFTTMREKMKTLQILDMSGVTELPKETAYLLPDGRKAEVQSIPSGALRENNTLHTVVFPAVIEYINYDSFASCPNLQTIDFSLARNILLLQGFSGCNNISELDLSKCINLEYLSGFNYCSKLEFVNLSGCTNLKTIGNGCFSNCSSLKEVEMPTASALVSIESYAFNKAALESIDLSNCNYLKEIGVNAFSYTQNLTSFDFESLTSLETIGDQAFSYSGLIGSLTFNSKLQKFGNEVFKGTNVTSLDFSKCSNLLDISDNAFSNCSTLEEIIINNSGYKSQDGVFFSADMTTLICYPNGKKDVSYTIPSTVVTIKSIDNQSLKKIVIPESVKSIARKAFGSSILHSKRTTILYMQSSTPIGMSESIGDIASVHVPKGAAEAYRNAAVWKEYPIIEEDADPISITLTTAGTLQSEIEKLNLKKEEITKLIVSGPMNNVDFNVFSLMKNLSSIDLTKAEIPNNILPSNSFENLLFLEKVQLPESIEGIGFFAFSGCTSLKSINVFQLVNLTAIEGSAFAGCSIWNTENIKFPKTLNVLGTYAFSSMSPSSITLKSKEKVTTMDGDPFPDTDKEACVLYVPKGMKAEYQADPIWGLFKQIQEFGLLVTITSNVNNQNFIIKGAGAYEQGESASLEAYMNDDRYGLSLFDGWYEDGKKISSELSYSFKVEDKDRTLKAHFTNFDFSGYCQTTSNDGKTAKVKFSLPADAVNLAFDGWYEDNKLISKETELTLEASSADRRTIEARTVSTLAKLTITNTTPDYGNVLQSGSGEYEKGTKVQVKALPYAGYKFVGWYQNSKLLSEETTYELTLTAQETTIEARFAIDDKQEEVHTLVIGTEGSHAGGQVSVQGLAKVGEQITVTAIPDAGYAFEGWYLDGKLIETALMSSTFKVEESMKQLVAKFKALPFQLETDGGEEGWAEVLLYRDSKVYMTAKKVSGYTFLGWYLGDKLLSTSYDYTFDVSQLRASLPTLKAKYFHGIVANESISSEKAIQIYRKDARLVIQSAVPIAQVEIYSFAGTLLHSEGGFEQEAQINAPSGSFIIRLKTADDEYIVRKVR